VRHLSFTGATSCLHFHERIDAVIPGSFINSNKAGSLQTSEGPAYGGPRKAQTPGDIFLGRKAALGFVR
jgi:hypothetical protein